MSWRPCPDPTPGDARSCAAVETLIVSRTADIGGFDVRRVLPSSRRRMVGPFIFLDQMGPAEFVIGEGLDVRPHPHIGLATVTYLFSGEIVHRDSLGVEQAIRPGAVNWMTAGRGIVHSERTGAGPRASGGPLYGLQSWVALPAALEETDPAFSHIGADDTPVIEGEGKRVRLVAGSLYGAFSPTATHSDMFYAEVVLDAGATLSVPADYPERAIYVVEGAVDIAGDRFEPGQLLVLREGDAVDVVAPSASRLMLLGGEPMEGRRYIWWNFVSSSKERIEQAKADWSAGRFDSVPGDAEYVPLPDI